VTAPVLLDVRSVTKRFGGFQALGGVSLQVFAGERFGLIGPNGSGKTTLINCVSGALRNDEGAIWFEGQDITRLAPHQIVRRGIVQVAEGRAILTTLTVRENLALGAYTRRDRAGIANSLEEVFHLFPRLRERGEQLAGNLSGGEQQMLAIGRALMARPRLLLLDEPSMGLAPLLVREIFKTLVDINRSGLSVLLVEQNVRQALKIARHGYVMETGQVVLADSGANLLRDPRVAEAYLGG